MSTPSKTKFTTGEKIALKLRLSTVNANVDEVKGTIKNVVIMQVGPAKGHGVIITPPSLDSLVVSAIDKPTQSSYFTHNSTLYVTDRLGEELGFFTNIRKEGEQVLGDFEFLNSARKYATQKVEHILEMAVKMPHNFGMSISFYGVVGEVTGDMPPEILVTELESIDFVSRPAATTSLFSKFQSFMKNMLSTTTEEVSPAVAAPVAVPVVETAPVAVALAATPEVPVVAPVVAPTPVPVVLATPAPAPVVIDFAQERVTLEARITELSTKLSAAEATVKELQNVRREISKGSFKTALPTLDNVGAEVKNPFTKEHYNETEQGRLYKKDKALYSALKAEAAEMAKNEAKK